MAEQPAGTTPTGNNQNLLIIGGIVLVLVVLGGFVVFGRDTAEEGEFNTNAVQEDIDAAVPEEETITEVAPLDDVVQGEVKEFTIDGSNFAFSVKEIRVNEGDTVRIKLTNGSTMPHDWRVDEFSAATNVVQPGQEDTIEFVADQAGTYEYYCSVGQHRQLGMVGNLIVE
jgi:plastocyanin